MTITSKDIEPRVIVSTDLDVFVHGQLKDLAKRNQRSVAGEMRYVLEQHVRSNQQEEVKDGA